MNKRILHRKLEKRHRSISTSCEGPPMLRVSSSSERHSILTNALADEPVSLHKAFGRSSKRCGSYTAHISSPSCDCLFSSCSSKLLGSNSSNFGCRVLNGFLYFFLFCKKAEI